MRHDRLLEEAVECEQGGLTFEAEGEDLEIVRHALELFVRSSNSISGGSAPQRYIFASAWDGGTRFIHGETYVLASAFDARCRRIAELEKALTDAADYLVKHRMLGEESMFIEDIRSTVDRGVASDGK